MIEYMVDETPAEPFVGSINADSLVIDGNALLHKNIDRAILMSRNQLQQGWGEGKVLSPPLDRSPILVIVFGESKVVHQVSVNWVTVMLEGYLDVEDAIIEIIEPSFEADVG